MRVRHVVIHTKVGPERYEESDLQVSADCLIAIRQSTDPGLFEVSLIGETENISYWNCSSFKAYPPDADVT